jgi:hypothetical protein
MKVEINDKFFKYGVYVSKLCTIVLRSTSIINGIEHKRINKITTEKTFMPVFTIINRVSVLANGDIYYHLDDLSFKDKGFLETELYSSEEECKKECNNLNNANRLFTIIKGEEVNKEFK